MKILRLSERPLFGDCFEATAGLKKEIVKHPKIVTINNTTTTATITFFQNEIIDTNLIYSLRGLRNPACEREYIAEILLIIGDIIMV